MRVEQIMTRDVKVCRPDDTLNRAAQLMWEFDCGCIPVISTDGSGVLLGVITDRDIAIAAYTQGRPPSGIPVATAMARKVIACNASDGISQAEALMRDSQVRRLPVVDQNGRLVGILSLDDIAREAQREIASGAPAEVSAEGLSQTLAAICQPRRPHKTAAVA